MKQSQTGGAFQRADIRLARKKKGGEGVTLSKMVSAQWLSRIPITNSVTQMQPRSRRRRRRRKYNVQIITTNKQVLEDAADVD